ncbi:MAG: hypothetical protein KJO36_09900, partial [Acidimicrobiia bacterium]|nr:hypothetical protein [Acidimicrobiia bacterium]
MGVFIVAPMLCYAAVYSVRGTDPRRILAFRTRSERQRWIDACPDNGILCRLTMDAESADVRRRKPHRVYSVDRDGNARQLLSPFPPPN